MNPLKTRELLPMTHPNIAVLSQKDALDHIEKIARLRIEIFIEYPYLYEGDMEYESMYLKKFLNSPDFVIVVLKDGNEVVGAMTGLPLIDEEPNITHPWIEAGLSIGHVYYFSEILLYPKYRRKGYGRRIFQLAEAHIAKFGKYTQSSLATVVREKIHPMRPHDYSDTDRFWETLGYQKRDRFICHISWREIGEGEDSNKPLVFWTKDLGSKLNTLN